MVSANLVANYRDFITDLPLPAFIVVQKQGTFYFEFANTALLRASDLRPDRMIGAKVADLFPGETGRYMLENYQRCFARKIPVEFDLTLEQSDGPHDWHTNLHPLIPPDGAVQALVGYATDVTGRRVGAPETLAAHRVFRDSGETQEELVIHLAPDLTLLSVNPAFAQAMGARPADLIGTCLLDRMSVGDQVQMRAHFADFTPAKKRQSVTYALETAAGRRVWQRWQETAEFDGDGRMTAVHAVGHDVTAMQDALFRALHSEIQFRAVVDNVSEGIILADVRGTIKYANAKMRDILGWEPTELIGLNVAVLANPTDAKRHDSFLRRYLETSVPHVIGIGRETIGQHRNGTLVPIHLSLSDVMLEGGRHFVGVIRDNTAINEANNRIERLAFRDELTGLPNRRQITDQIQRHLKDGTSLAYLIVDICNFSRLNNAVGFTIGDQVLQTTVRQITRMVPEDAVVARVGGDQFGILLPGPIGYGILDAMARKIASAIEGEMVAGPDDGTLDSFFLPPVTIGAATAPRHADTAAELFEAAEIALIEAKRTGPGSVCLFNTDMRTAIDRQFSLAQGLRRALERHELVAYVQPRFRTSDGMCVGGEALVRWIDSSGRMISPADFIPVAEETGLVQPITFLMLDQVMPLLRQLLPGQRISVNFPPAVLTRRNLAGALKIYLEKNQVPGSALAIEVTESALTGDQTMLDRTLRDLRALGIAVAIDDFGTGYSSLSRLQTLPIDELKIDRAFVREAARSQAGAQFLTAIAGMGRALGLSLIAEGVETEAELAEVRRTHCNEVQGYLWGRPMPIPEFEEVLRTRSGVMEPHG